MLVRLGWTLLLVERCTSITTSQRSKASNPSMRYPASREMISDSVELSETAVCFLHIQLTGTNVLLPKYTRHLPMLISSPQSRQQSLSLETNPVNNAVACFPHDNIVGNRLCDEYKKSALPIVCHMPESILLTDLASLLTDHRMSSRPMRAKYMHFMTMCEQTLGASSKFT